MTLELLELLFLANSKKGQAKLPPLQQADLKLSLLKVLIRLAYDSKAIHLKHYIRLQEKLHEIGRMLGGWIKSLFVGKED